MSNRLADQTSPYLRQHAGNPVDWWPWCDEAWAQARRLDRPVLLSVGYSACHWCHVMAHESFENEDIAALQNELFVNIKVDREERPDVDAVYMQAVQAMTGQGGWPMTVFCTPRAVPYFGGTYFPPEDRHGMRGFPFVLRAAADAYRSQREAVDQTGTQLRQALTPPRLPPGEAELTPALLDAIAAGLTAQTDRRNGGFGGAPKFPHPAALDTMLRHSRATGVPAAADAALLSLDRMARGGVHDQLGGGFHRYSVDAQWAVPHFEKMLYDNVQLAPVALHAHLLTGDARWRDLCVEILEYLLREMRLPGGGFASTQDADTPAGEGAYFVWTPAELEEVLGGEEGALAARLFGVTAAGNVEGGATVLSFPFPLETVAASLGVPLEDLARRLAGMRSRLAAARSRRHPPGRDDKVITAWNGLAIGAFAEAGAALQRPDLIEAARRCAGFVLERLRAGDGAPLRSWLDGSARVRGFLEDSAFLCDGLLTLHAATGEARWFAAACELADDMLRRFLDPVAGFHDTPLDGEPLLVRPRTIDDNAVPAGQSIAAVALLRLAALTGHDRYRAAGLQVVDPLATAATRSPLAFANLAWALELAVREVREVAVTGPADHPGVAALVRTVHERWDPTVVLAWGEVTGVPLLADRPAPGGVPTAYVCRGFTCDAPVTTPQALADQLARRKAVVQFVPRVS